MAVLSGGVFEGNRDTAVWAFNEGTSVTLEDVVVRETRSLESSGRGGAGLTVHDRAEAVVTRGVFERNRYAAVIAFHEGTSVTFHDAVVRDTLERECAHETCGVYGAGAGVVAGGGADVDLTGFIVSGNASCGIQLVHGEGAGGVRYEVGGTMDLHEGVIADNAVCGANVQTAGFDLSRLSDHVIFRDNGRDLDMSELPVPEAGI